MREKNNLDFLSFEFPEVFLRFFGSDGRLPYFLKCIALGIIAWTPGLTVTYLSGTLSMYLADAAHFSFDIGLGISLFIIVYLCRRINPTLQEVDSLAQHSRDEGFPKFVKDWNNSSSFWYYLCAIAPPVLFFITDLLHVLAPGVPHGPYPPWADESVVSWEIVRLNTPYIAFEHAIVGLLLGIGFNRFLHYLLFIRDYGRSFLYNTNLDLLFQNIMDGLKPLGRLALESSLVITVPLCLVSISFFEHLIRKQCMSYTWLFALIGFVVVLMLTVIFQVICPRRILLNAKRDAISFVDSKILELRTRIANDISGLSTLGELFTLRERLDKTSTWIFDTTLVFRFFLTIFLPILGGAIIQIVLEYLISSSL